MVGGERVWCVEGVTSLAVLPNGSAVGVKADALVDALFLCCLFHTLSQDKTTVRHSQQRRERYWTLAQSCGNLSLEWAVGGALWNSRKTGVALGCVLLFFPLQTGKLIAAAGRKQRRRLQRVPEASERCRCAWCKIVVGTVAGKVISSIDEMLTLLRERICEHVGDGAGVGFCYVLRQSRIGYVVFDCVCL